MKVLIVSGYHPKETFATEVGEHLLQSFSRADIEIVKYTGKPDSGISTRHLRRFIKKFDPLISPIILHCDDDFGCEVIVYSAKSKQEAKVALKPLVDFCLGHSRGDRIVVWGIFLFPRANHNIIDIELNSKMGIREASNLVLFFVQYLLDLYSSKNIKL